ncbi:MAG: MATE family efflux transporter [Marinilabiliaceae bacterium]|nr:MATE family efflux transporter [Marinilabiliaceae bacterium]
MKDLTKGHVGRVILSFAMPLVIANLLQQGYNFVDRLIVGNYLGKEALAAVGASFPVIYTLIAFAIGIGSGATVVISQFFGAKKFNEVQKTVSTIFIYLFITSIGLTILSVSFSDQIFNVLNVEETVHVMAKQYFNIYMFGIVAFFGFNGIASVLRGMGDSLTPLLFMFIAFISNIILDILFITVFNWGVAGAAWATVIAHFIPFLLGAFFLTRRHQLISFRIGELKFDKGIFGKIIKIGLPTAFQQTFIALGLTALIRIVNNFDTTVLAAYTIAGQIDSMAGMPALNLSSALSAFVGQNIGAQKFDRIRNGYWATLVMAWLMSIIVMVVVFIWGDMLIGIFNKDLDVVVYGTQYLKIVSSFYLVFSTMFITHGLLRGAGDTLIPMFISIVSLWLVRIPFAIYLSEIYGVIGIWWAIPIGWSIGLVLSQTYFFWGRWKTKSIVIRN